MQLNESSDTGEGFGELLTENVEGKKLYLVEETVYFDLSLNESEIVTESYDDLGNAIIRAKGEFGFCDKPTANRRRYSRRIMEREIRKLQSKIDRGNLLGELDHPKDGETRAERVAIRIDVLEIKDNGSVYGEFTVLSDRVPRARLLRGLVESGIRLGVSSRGLGSVKKSPDGMYDVLDDFNLLTYDVVVDPAWRDAHPTYSINEEHLNNNIQESVMPLSAQERVLAFKAKNPELYQHIVESIESNHREDVRLIQAQNQQQIAEAVSNAVMNTRQQVEAEMMTRQNLTGGSTGAQVLENIRELVNNPGASTKELEEARNVASRYRQKFEEAQSRLEILESEKMHIEMKAIVAEHVSCVAEDDHQNFYNLLGEASDYTSMDVFQQRLDAIVEDFEQQGRYNANIVEDYENTVAQNQSLNDRLAEAEVIIAESIVEIESLQENNATLSEALEVRTNLLEEANSENIRLTAKNNELQSSLNEATSRLDEATSLIEEGIEEIQTKTRLLEESAEEISEMFDKLEESDLDLHRHKKVIGLTNPNAVLQKLSEAKDIEGVDSLFESLQGGSTQPVDPQPAPSMLNEGQQQPQPGAVANSRNVAINAVRKSMNPDYVQQASSLAESVTAGQGGVPNVGSRRAIPGMTPSKLSDSMNGVYSD